MRLKSCAIAFAILASCLLTLSGCRRVVQAPPPTPPAASAKTPASTFQSSSGKVYTRTPVGPADDDEPVNIPPLPPGAAPNQDNYHGTARKAAKLSIVSGTPEGFIDIAALLDSLPADGVMRALHIDKGPDSGRVTQEQRLVTTSGFLYAASKESDNDFHCIVGVDPRQPARYMNVEISALPPSSSEFFAPLRAARNEFKQFFMTSSADALPTSGYEKYDPPIPVKITGSTFFDVDHVPPAVGPTGMKPQSAWEIHPVSDIQFEP